MSATKLIDELDPRKGPGGRPKPRNTNDRSNPSSGNRPAWSRALTLALIVFLAGWVPGEMFPAASPIRSLSALAQPWTTTASGVLVALALVLFVFGGTGNDAVREAIITQLKIPAGKQHQVTVTLRRSPLRRRVRRLRITLPLGMFSQDPSRQLAMFLEPFVGQMRRRAWKPLKGKLVLEAGAPDPTDTEIEVPEAEGEPEKRIHQIAERVLRTENISTAVLERDADGNPTTIQVKHDTDPRMAAEGAQATLQGRISKLMPQAPGGRGWELKLRPDRNHFLLHAREPIPNFLLHPVIDYSQYGENKRMIPFATTVGDRHVCWNVSRGTQKPHALVVGPTGGGKTSVIRTFVVGATRQRMEVKGCDPKMIELMGLDGWPGVSDLAYTIPEMAALIDAAHDEMMDRYERIRAREVHPNELDALLLILDEYLIFRHMLVSWWKEELGKKGNPPAIGQSQRMLALSRSAGMFLCLGVQRPDASLFDEGSRDNLRTRISLDQLSEQGARMMWGDGTIGVNPSPTPGRAWAIDHVTGTPVEAQCWWTPDLDLHPLYRDALSEQERARVDELRPEEWAIRPSGFAVPKPQKPKIPEGSVQSDLMGMDDVVYARELNEGDRILMMRGGRFEIATIDEDPEYDDGDHEVDLHLTWDQGGSSEIVTVAENERIPLLGKE